MPGGPGSATTSCSPASCSWSCGAARRPTLPALHTAAAGWYAQHGYPVEAGRHAQAAEDWALAASLLADHWVGLGLNGLGATAHELLARFPAGVIAGDTELAARMAGHELARGSLAEAERYLTLATAGLESVPADRRGRAQVALAVVRLQFSRYRGDLPAVAEQAQRLLAPVGAADPARFGVGEDLRALALINLGIAELWTAGFDEADRDLEQGVALAHRIGRPYLEVTGLAHWAQLLSWRSFPLGAQRGREAIELAGRHGWDRSGRSGGRDGRARSHDRRVRAPAQRPSLGRAGLAARGDRPRRAR